LTSGRFSFFALNEQPPGLLSRCPVEERSALESLSVKRHRKGKGLGAAWVNLDGAGGGGFHGFVP
jgi:hypothetical protein